MNLLPRLFVKDYKNYQNASVRFAYGKMCGIVGIISNLILICNVLLNYFYLKFYFLSMRNKLI